MRLVVLAVPLSSLTACLRPVAVMKPRGGADLLLEPTPIRKRCARKIDVLSKAPSAAYRLVRVIEVTCGTYPADCEAILTERACELEADAVIVEPLSVAAASAPPPEVRGTFAVTKTGRAIVWVTDP